MSDDPNKLAEDGVADVDAAGLASEQSETPEVASADEAGSDEAAVSPTEERQAEEQEAAVEEAVSDEAASEIEASEVEGVEESTEEEVAEGEDAADSDESSGEEDVNEEQAADEADVEEEAEVEAEADSDEIKKDWYILKVQSNREKSITAALKRKIAVEGLEDYFGEVVVPVEKVTEFKGGKKKVVNRKLYPGYIVVNMCINDDTWFAVRETSGIGDFTGSGGKPTPMLASEVARIIQTEEEETEDAPKLNISFKIGDRVKVNDGNFESFEGEVNAIDEHSGRITVMINIFGRSTPVELEYWQVEQT